MHVQFITVGQCIQTENKRHIVVEQTGLWREETHWAAHDHINQQRSIQNLLKILTSMVQILLNPSLCAKEIVFATSS